MPSIDPRCYSVPHAAAALVVVMTTLWWRHHCKI